MAHSSWRMWNSESLGSGFDNLLFEAANNRQLSAVSYSNAECHTARTLGREEAGALFIARAYGCTRVRVCATNAECGMN